MSSLNGLEIFRRIYRKIENLLSCYLLVRSTSYSGLDLKFVGIGNKTNELIAMQSDGIYEKVMVDRFIEEAKKSKVFFDIGGNIGNYSIVYRKVSLGEIHCWEPEAKYNILHRINHKINFKSIKKISIHKKFVGIRSSDRVTELNSFCADENAYPDLIKIDVEGAEAQILPSLGADFYKNSPKIFLEYHPVDILHQFGLCPAEFMRYIYDNFTEIEINENHWGAFKGSPPGVWREATVDEVLKITEDILAGSRSPRGFGLILRR